MNTSAETADATRQQKKEATITGHAAGRRSSGTARVIREPAPRDVIILTGSTGNVAPPGQEYVDPYLFETGHFASREEYEELSRTAKIKASASA